MNSSKPVHEISEAERIEGGLIGLLIGDALGVPYEFMPAELIPPRAQIEFEPPTGFDRSHSSVPAGTWSDDGAQALCLLASLLSHGHLDLDDFGQRLVNWHDRGDLAVDGFVFDCGIQTSRAISALRSGVSPERAGPRGERDNGNGSLMRVLPVAIWHQGCDRDLAALATRQSLVTHGHLRACLCCEMYCLWAKRIIAGQGIEHAWADAMTGLRQIHTHQPNAIEEIDGPMTLLSDYEITAGGYVVDCLHSARFALRGSSFEEVVKTAVALGNDTDTTAAVAGGLAGLRYGIEGIPRRWRRNLRGRSELSPLLDELLEMRCPR